MTDNSAPTPSDVPSYNANPNPLVPIDLETLQQLVKVAEERLLTDSSSYSCTDMHIKAAFDTAIRLVALPTQDARKALFTTGANSITSTFNRTLQELDSICTFILNGYYDQDNLAQMDKDTINEYVRQYRLTH